MARSVYSEITPEMETLADLCVKNGKIDPELYAKYDVKRGLRDINGNGVLTGLTDISEIRSSRMENGVKIPCEGQLFYRGYSIEDLVRSMPGDHSFGFEVTAYLLLFGELPSKEQLDGFIKQLSFYRTLPTNFVRDIIMKAPSGDMMNTLARSVLTMYSYDDAPDDISIPNVLRQCIQLIAIFPLLSVYGSDSEYYIINKSGKRIKKFEYGVAAAVSTAPGEFAVYGADGKCGLYRGEKQI